MPYLKRFISVEEIARLWPDEDIGKEWECYFFLGRIPGVGTDEVCPGKGIVLDNYDGRSLCLAHAIHRGYKEGIRNANQATKP